MILGKLIAALAIGVGALAGCRDREQQAGIDGAAARAEAARACATADPDGGEPERRSACLGDRCRERCGAYAGTRTFERVCIDACVAEGACMTDADCGAGLRCIAVAPVVRRCTAPR